LLWAQASQLEASGGLSRNDADFYKACVKRTLQAGKTMRRWPICIILSISISLGSQIVHVPNDRAGRVIQLVNQLRASNGLAPYQVDAVLMSVAQAQASWSAENNHIGHDGPGGSSPNDRAQAAGYGGGERSFAVENAAHGTTSINTPELVVTMWQSDWGHLSAMISAEYEHIGVGYAEAGGYSWYVMMVGWVGSPAGASNTNSKEPLGESIPASPFVLSEPDETGAIYHEVQPGQAAWTIAAYYGVDLAELLALNQLTEESILHPGDILMVRPPEPTTPQPLANLPTQIPRTTPVAIQTIPVISPTFEKAALVESHPRSIASPILLILGSGMVLIASFVLIRSYIARR
jgi:LysM repeat protein